MPRHLGTLDGDGEQAIALLGGQKGSDGQGGLVAEGEGLSESTWLSTPFCNRVLKGFSLGSVVTVKSIRKRSFVKDAKPAAAGLLVGYARVSKGDEQNNSFQAKALRVARCRRLFEESASGGRWDRPELHRMLDQLR
jgi:hypothetical protein